MNKSSHNKKFLEAPRAAIGLYVETVIRKGVCVITKCCVSDSASQGVIQHAWRINQYMSITLKGMMDRPSGVSTKLWKIVVRKTVSSSTKTFLRRQDEEVTNQPNKTQGVNYRTLGLDYPPLIAIIIALFFTWAGGTLFSHCLFYDWNCLIRPEMQRKDFPLGEGGEYFPTLRPSLREK